MGTAVWAAQEIPRACLRGGIVGAMECFEPQRVDPLGRPIKQREMRLRPTDIPGKDHRCLGELLSRCPVS